jgi:hypothetical protein
MQSRHAHPALNVAVAGSPIAAKGSRPIRRFTEAEKTTFREEWDQGTAVKLIAHKLKTTVKQIHQMRRDMGLAPRSARKHRKHYVKVHVDEADWIRIRGKARLRGTTISAYLRYLIQRDY